MSGFMAIVAASAGATGKRLVWPMVIGIAVAGLAIGSADPRAPASADITGTWLHLPCAALALVAVGAALEHWPLLTRARAGGGLLRTLHPSGIDGCVPAACGALAALLIALCGAAVAFTACRAIRGVPLTAARHYEPAAIDGTATLDRAQRQLVARPTPGCEWSGLHVNARAWRTTDEGFHAPTIRLFADGEVLHAEPIQIEGSDQPLVLWFTPRTISELTIAIATPGSFVLHFAPGSIQTIRSAPHSPFVNAPLAALTYLFPAALALALTMLGRRAVGLPVGLVIGAGCVVAFATGDWLPNADAIALQAAHRWVLTGDFLVMAAVSLGIVAAPMCSASLVSGRRTP